MEDAPDGIVVSSPGAAAGTMTLSKEPSALPTRSIWKGLDAGQSWTTSKITFGFGAGAADYYGAPLYSSYGEPAQFIALSAAGKGIVRAAFSSWGNAVPIALAETKGGSHPQINLGGSAIPDTAWAYYPGSADSAGDVWFGLDQPYFSKLVSGTSRYIGSYEYATALHEIGHALGLKHPHQGSPTVPAAYDGLEYSVMSYRSYLGGSASYYTVGTWSYPQSLMMLDIAAIQDIYGADFTTQSGNSVYRFNPLTGEMTINGSSAGVPGGNVVFRTLWDGGGTDTIDLSNYATDLAIDLNPGKAIDLDVGGFAQRAQLSTSVYAAHHVYMSLLHNGDTRSLIENATGGAGDDILIGNQLANVLKGGSGDDSLTGGLGADTFALGNGADTVTDTLAGLNGDKITDFNATVDRIVVKGVKLGAGQVSYNTATDKLTIDTNRDGQAEAVLSLNLGAASPLISLVAVSAGTEITFSSGTSAAAAASPAMTALTLTAAADTYTSTVTLSQIVHGLAGNDKITTSSGHDALYGEDGNDTLKGAAGNDTLSGGTGADLLYGGAGDDVLEGGTGTDKLYGDAGDDLLSGDAGTDYLYGGDGDDMLAGGDDADRLYGNAGTDVLLGDAGADLLYGGTGDDLLKGGTDNDKLYGDAGDDTLLGEVGNDYLYGGDGDDTLYGETGADRLYGNAGADTLLGEAGADLLYGGDGNDVLEGGADNDKLYGEAGNDILNSGAGTKEYLIGGAGRDRFVFEAADFTAGVSTSKYVTDFAIAQDSLQLAGFAATALTAFAPRDTASGLRLTVDTANYIYLKGVTLATLGAVDVSFSAASAAASTPEEDGVQTADAADPVDVFNFHDIYDAQDIDAWALG